MLFAPPNSESVGIINNNLLGLITFEHIYMPPTTNIKLLAESFIEMGPQCLSSAEAQKCDVCCLQNVRQQKDSHSCND